jgi:hypothetical protein
MVEQEEDRIDDVLLGDLHDLELREKELGQGDRGAVILEPAVEGDRVAELEAIEEDVDVNAGRRVVEQPASAFRGDEHLAILGIAQGGKKFPRFPRLTPVAGEVDVRVRPAEGRQERGSAWAMERHPERPEDAEGHVRPPASLDDPVHLVLEDAPLDDARDLVWAWRHRRG